MPLWLLVSWARVVTRERDFDDLLSAEKVQQPCFQAAPRRDRFAGWILQSRDEVWHGLGTYLADGLCGLQALLKLVGAKVVEPRPQTPALPYRTYRVEDGNHDAQHGQSGDCNRNQGEPFLSHGGILADARERFNAFARPRRVLVVAAPSAARATRLSQLTSLRNSFRAPRRGWTPQILRESRKLPLKCTCKQRGFRAIRL
jgi:hypothetical protein